VGFAAVEVLGRLPDLAGIPHLTQLRARLRGAGPRRRVEAAIAKAAEARGLRAEELEEIAAPTCGLGADGRREDVLGSFRSVVVPDGRGGVTWTWSGPDGRARTSVPAPVRRDHAAQVKALTAEVREVPAMLRAQADRLERFLLDERRLTAAAWRDRYLDHPLLRHVARRLVWVVEDAEGSREVAWAGDAIRTVDDAVAPAPAPDATVRLWHPVQARTEVVAAWRRFLERHGITQPFKQAHREIYRLTPAELDTETYSNRFAAHVLKQHQLAELARARGWSYRLQGGFDGDEVAVRALPRHDMQAQFVVEADMDHQTEAGISLYVRTDQVTFLTTAGEPVPIHRVPPLVLSEVMRDVDLFVGVASIGNDPTWVDHGERPHGGYWREFAFGELSELARTRRATLESLVPRLAIASRCSFTDRHLLVRGDLRTYKIHLGSGHILMEPDDAYLCIVAAPSRRDDPGPLYVPFEGDRVLSLIVSKALLLADDARIADPSIRAQIARR
jgi:hypothetical protein